MKRYHVTLYFEETYEVMAEDEETAIATAGDEDNEQKGGKLISIYFAEGRDPICEEIADVN